MEYYVFEVYHKKGKYDIKNFETEDELNDYMFQYIEKYKKYSKFDNRNESTYNVMKEVLKIGQIVLEQKAGYAIVKIISGSEIEESFSSEEYESSEDCMKRNSSSEFSSSSYSDSD
jgi:hypothetical protein